MAEPITFALFIDENTSEEERQAASHTCKGGPTWFPWICRSGGAGVCVIFQVQPGGHMQNGCGDVIRFFTPVESSKFPSYSSNTILVHHVAQCYNILLRSTVAPFSK